MEDLVRQHRRALDATGRIVAGITRDQLADPTPCEGWDVETLLTHVVSGNLWVGELTAGKTIDDVGDRLDGDVLGDDLAVAYDASAHVADAGFSAEGAMAAPVAVSYGPVPGEVYAGHRLIDVVVHGWDLAKATGQDTTLDPALVDACQEVLAPQIDMLQASGMFGSPGAVASEVDPQSRLLAQLGREP